jgi:hypothetical protein
VLAAAGAAWERGGGNGTEHEEVARGMDVLTSRTIIHPSDLEASLAFYGGALDLPVAREFGVGEGRGVVFFAGGGLIEVVAARQTGPTHPSPCGCRSDPSTPRSTSWWPGAWNWSGRPPVSPGG